MATGMEKSNFIKHISHVKSSEIDTLTTRQLTTLVKAQAVSG